MYSTLINAIKKNDLQKVKQAIENGVNVNIYRNDSNKLSPTPLFIACLCGNEEIVKLLLENGASTNLTLAENDSVDEDDYEQSYPSALHAACIFTKNRNCKSIIKSIQ